MSRKLLGLPLVGLLLSNLGCNGQPPAPPPIAPGDYASIIGYLKPVSYTHLTLPTILLV